MCAINGIYWLRHDTARPRPDDIRRRLIAMNDAVAHRGPDGHGIYLHDQAGLAHRRLSIIDLSLNAAQPMCSADGDIVLVFNGEIYNYKELMTELASHGHVFRTMSDTEVIIHSYARWGTECVKRFNGMWAFALHDKKNRRLFASRDRLGVKPFFYSLDADRLVFSSEVKAVLAVTGARTANLGKAYDYLAYGYRTNNGETFFRDIQELPPATNLTVEDGRISQAVYWRLPPPIPDAPARPLDDLAETFRSLLQDAIKLRFRSDVPVAILLSGGLDSTAIASTVDHLVGTRELAPSRVQAFTAVFPGFEEDESQIVAKFLSSCRHIDMQPVMPAAETLPHVMTEMAYALGEPVFSATVYAHFELLRAMRTTGIKVALNGQGSDEAFGGYDRYYLGYILRDVLSTRPAETPAQLRAMRRHLGYPRPYIATQFAKTLFTRRFAAYLRGRFQERIVPCLDPKFSAEHYRNLAPPREPAASRFDRHLREQLNYFGFNQILHYEDHSSMAHSVEMRSPFVDYRLMEFAFSLPTAAKYDRGVTKRVIRHAFRDKLPSEIIHNRRKIGFAAPMKQWLQDATFQPFVKDTLASSSFGQRSIWNADAIRRRFVAPAATPQFPFWRVLNFHLWADAYRVEGL